MSRGGQYCVCQDRRIGGTMVCCDSCDVWFHVKCVGLLAREASALPSYECVSCSRAKKRARAAARRKRRLAAKLAARTRKRRRDNAHAKAMSERDDVDDMDEMVEYFDSSSESEGTNQDEHDEGEEVVVVDEESPDMHIDIEMPDSSPRSLRRTSPNKRTAVRITFAEGLTEESRLDRLPDDCLQAIFEFLECPTGLLIAAQVCKRWQRIAHLPSLWLVASIDVASEVSPLCVRRVLQAHGSCERVELFASALMRPVRWASVLSAVGSSEHIRSLQLYEPPARAISAVPVPALAPRLQSFAAFDVYLDEGEDACIDIGHLSGLSSLRELAVDAPVPFDLPPFSMSGPISQLGSLSQLRVLELHDLEDRACVSARFLGGLTGLSRLSVGSCRLWGAAEFDELATLSQLCSLELRFLGVELLEDEEATYSLARALKSLKSLQVLEFFECILPPKLAEGLSACTSIKRLVIHGAQDSPDAEFFPHMDRALLQPLASCTFLQQLEWRLSPSRYTDLTGHVEDALMSALGNTSISLLELA